MNWNDTVGQYIHAKMYNKALEIKPYADKDKLNESINRAGITVGLVRQAIAELIEAEVSGLAMMRVLGEDQYTIDFLAGMIAIGEFIRTGKHISGE